MNEATTLLRKTPSKAKAIASTAPYGRWRTASNIFITEVISSRRQSGTSHRYAHESGGQANEQISYYISKGCGPSAVRSCQGCFGPVFARLFMGEQNATRSNSGNMDSKLPRGK